MPRVFITGSTDGLGRAAAGVLITEGHGVVLHARTRERAAALSDLVPDTAGVVIGVPCALAATRLIAHVLFGIAPGDPLAFMVAASTLLVIGALGGFWPARRAMNTDPIIALRSE